MPKFCVRIDEQLPAVECEVEAADPEKAAEIRWRQLEDWASLSKLCVYPADAGKRKPS